MEIQARWPLIGILAVGILGNTQCGLRGRNNAQEDAPGPRIPHIQAGIGWFFLPEDPVPTGSAPNVIIGATPRCDLEPIMASVSEPQEPLRVTLITRPKTTNQCPATTPFIDYVSLQRLRLGTFTVTSAVGATPPVTLRVVEDTPTALGDVMLRRVRACTVGNDASCTGGGICASVPSREQGVCVPPLDPYLVVHRPCPEGRHEVELGHSGESPQPGPTATTTIIHACLPMCSEAGSCPTGLTCAQISGRSVCVR